MASLSLYSKILRGTWLIDKESSEGYLIAALQMISGNQISGIEVEESLITEQMTPYAMIAARSGSYDRYREYNDAPEGSIAVIPVKGALNKDDYCGYPGTATMAQRIKEANNHPNISAIVLHMDSPGGSVDGTEHFADTVGLSDKPVVTFVDGLAGSAAYWIASQSDSIVLSGETTKVGSIGTMATIRSYAKYYEEMGIDIFEVYASKSTEKNKALRDLVEKNNEATIRNEHLDPLNKVFLASVELGREDKINLEAENVLSGKIYHGTRAIEVGLADEIGDFDRAIETARELSDTTAIFNNPSDTMLNRKFKALTALQTKQKNGETVEAADIQAVNDELAQEGITAFVVVGADEQTAAQEAATALETMQAAHAAAVQVLDPEMSEEEIPDASLTELISQLATQHSEEVQGLNAQIEQLQADNKTLSEKSEEPKTPKKPAEKTETVAAEEVKWEDHPHNQQALKDLGELD